LAPNIDNTNALPSNRAKLPASSNLFLGILLSSQYFYCAYVPHNIIY